eukprot:RCo027568
MGLTPEEVESFRQQFLLSRSTARFLSPEELLGMEEQWLTEGVDPVAANQENSESGAEAFQLLTNTYLGTDWDLFVGAMLGFTLGFLVIPPAYLLPSPVKKKVGYVVGLLANLLFASA